MPLPLLFIIPSATAAIFGAGKTAKSFSDNKKAKEVNSSANSMLEHAKDALETQRVQTGKSLEQLGQLKMTILGRSIAAFLETFEKLKNVDFNDTTGLYEKGRLHIDQKDFEELRQMKNYAASFFSGGAAGATAGALTAFGAYSAASTFAFASTGAAISGLSGIAATNATLAFFGGGSLAAGGLGIAGGTAVLGGLIAGPALLVMGLITGAKASKNLDNAYSNRADAEKACKELSVAGEQCAAIMRRTYMFYNLLSRLDAYFLPAIFKLEDIINTSGTDYHSYSTDDKRIVSSAVSLAGTIKAVLDTAILEEDGSLTSKSKDLADSILASLPKKSVECE